MVEVIASGLADKASEAGFNDEGADGTLNDMGVDANADAHDLDTSLSAEPGVEDAGLTDADEVLNYPKPIIFKSYRLALEVGGVSLID